MAIAFDGPNRVITLATGETTVSVADLYSRWKDWVLASDNIKYPPAFRQAGGDPLGGGASAGINTFIRNDLGWRIKPPEANIVINLTGNIYPEDPDTVWRAGTTGDYETAINTNNAAAALIVTVSGEGGGSSPSASQIADAVWGEAVAESAVPGSVMARLKESFTLSDWMGLRPW